MARDATRHAPVPHGDVSFGLHKQPTNLKVTSERRKMQRSRTRAEYRELQRSKQNKHSGMLDQKYVRVGSLTRLLNSGQLCTARAAHKLERGHREKTRARGVKPPYEPLNTGNYNVLNRTNIQYAF